MIFYFVMDTIYQEYNHRLTQPNNTFLNPPPLESYARAIDSKGSPLPNCFGFVDGTVGQSVDPYKTRSFIMDVCEYMVSCASPLSYLMI